MEILEAYDLVGTLRGAAALANCDHHTVAHYVAEREAAGGEWKRKDRPCPRTEAHTDKIAEWVERSEGKVRADKVHERLAAMGYEGSERTTRRAVAKAKKAYRAGQLRVTRPWVTEPGLWMQWDYGEGPKIDDRPTSLFCAWLAWSRFRVVLPLADRTLPSVVWRSTAPCAPSAAPRPTP